MDSISKDILTKAANGDLESFEKVYRSFSGFVYNVAYRVTGSFETSQDVTQEVFIKVYKNLKRFQFRSSFKTWVYRITTNTAINAYRKRAKNINRAKRYNDALRYEQAGAVADEIVQRHDNKRLLEEFLRRLSPEQRICIVLREIQGLNYKEMAQALKININTVRSRLKRAREALFNYKKRGDE